MFPVTEFRVTGSCSRVGLGQHTTGIYAEASSRVKPVLRQDGNMISASSSRRRRKILRAKAVVSTGCQLSRAGHMRLTSGINGGVKLLAIGVFKQGRITGSPRSRRSVRPRRAVRIQLIPGIGAGRRRRVMTALRQSVRTRQPGNPRRNRAVRMRGTISIGVGESSRVMSVRRRVDVLTEARIRTPARAEHTGRI